MNDDIEDKIDAYIQNQMSAENREKFEEELSENEELRKHVNLLEKLKEGYARKDLYLLKEKLESLDAELNADKVNTPSVNIFQKYKILSLAASVLLLLGLGYFVFQHQNTNEIADLFEKNTPYNKFVTRSQESPFATLNNLLQNKQYDEVIKTVDGLMTNNSELNEDIVLLLEQGKAYALIASEDYAEASLILNAKNDCYSTWLKWCLSKKTDDGKAHDLRTKLSELDCPEYQNTIK